MEERMGEAFAGDERFTVVGKQLQPGEAAPDFCLDYQDLADRTVHTVGLADSAGMVRLLNVVNTLTNPICQHVTRRWEILCAVLPPVIPTFTLWKEKNHVVSLVVRF